MVFVLRQYYWRDNVKNYSERSLLKLNDTLQFTFFDEKTACPEIFFEFFNQWLQTAYLIIFLVYLIFFLRTNFFIIGRINSSLGNVWFIPSSITMSNIMSQQC